MDLDALYLLPLGHLLFAEPQKVGGGSNGQEKTPLVATKLGQTPRLTNELSMTVTASSVPTTLMFPLDDIMSTSLRKGKWRHENGASSQ